MEDVELQSPFKSPCATDPPSSSTSARHRVGSGSSASSTERDGLSPYQRKNVNSATATGSCSRAGSESRDENDPSVVRNGVGDLSRVNPFEKDILAGLQGSFWSPSILDVKETPPQRSWAIEHISQLFPKDIENSPSTHQNSYPVDEQMEAKAQADIDVYFSRGPIVPTPSPMKLKQNVFNVHGEALKLKTVNAAVHCGQSPITRSFGGNVKKHKKSVSVTERWTQTKLSLPFNLPPHIDQLLWEYSQNVNICGSSGEAGIQCSQKSEGSNHFENGDTNDSGKNSSSLNNSIRRRLELSFGEDIDGEESSQGLSQALSTSPIIDPFRRNHIVSTPPSSNFQLNTTTSDLEVQLMRCEFTPETRGPSSFSTTPGITPIQDEPDDIKYFHNHTCSTPRRSNSISKRSVSKLEPFVPPSSPGKETITSSSSNKFMLTEKTNNEIAQHKSLRRSRTNSPERMLNNKKRCSASSFDDSQLIMDDCSPPTKLCRRTSKNDETMADS